MPMILLSKGAEILLFQFHERKGDRVGAKAGDRLPESAFMEAAAESTGVDFDGATHSLLDGNLVRQEDGAFPPHPGGLRLPLYAIRSPDGGGIGVFAHPPDRLALYPIFTSSATSRSAWSPWTSSSKAGEPSGGLGGLQRAPAAAQPLPGREQRLRLRPRRTSGPATVTSCRRVRPFSRRTRGDCAAGGRARRGLARAGALLPRASAASVEYDCAGADFGFTRRSPRIRPPGMPPGCRAL